MSEFECVSTKWYEINEEIPIPDCGGGGGGNCWKKWVYTPVSTWVINPDEAREIDSVSIINDTVTSGQTVKNLFIVDKLSGDITVTDNIKSCNQDSDVNITVTGISGSKIENVRSSIKYIFADKNGNVVLDGFFGKIEGEIMNYLTITQDSFVQLSGNLTVKYLNNQGMLETNGFELIVLHEITGE